MVKVKPIYVVICPVTGARLCNDNKWRSLTEIGDSAKNVKVFKYKKRALNAAEKYSQDTSGMNRTHILYLYPGDELTKDGLVSRK